MGPSVFRQVLNGFTSASTRRPLLALLWLQIGWNLLYQYLPWMLARNSLGVGSTSTLLAIIGLGMCVAFVWLAGALQVRYPARRIAQVATAALATLCALLAVSLGSLMALPLAAATALAYGVAYTALIGHALACEQERLRGTVLGVAASLAAAAAAGTALLGGVLGAWGNGALASVTVISLVMSWALIRR